MFNYPLTINYFYCASFSKPNLKCREWPWVPACFCYTIESEVCFAFCLSALNLNKEFFCIFHEGIFIILTYHEQKTMENSALLTTITDTKSFTHYLVEVQNLLSAESV
jgi:hypothetical protein